MKIEEGKIYETRGGEKIGPMGKQVHPVFPFYGRNSKGAYLSYGHDGKWGCGGAETSSDLIAEWQDKPTHIGVDLASGHDTTVISHTVLLSWPDTASPEYAPLAAILQEAYDQAARGKGLDRHDNGKPFAEQRAMSIGRKVGPGFPVGQSLKKTEEAATMITKGHTGAAISELLGAINYAASAIMLIREQNPGA